MQRITHAGPDPENPVVTYTFNRIQHQGRVHAHVSTRHGGVSPAPWNTLNFSVSRGDDQPRVDQNRARFAQALGHEPAHVVRCNQVHGTGVAKVDWDDAGTFVGRVDGMITDAARLPLAWVFADCTPVLLYDPVTHTLGGCHAGWRGTVNGAAAATLWAMQAAYGVEASSVQAYIGPSIGPQSYEVGTEVWEMAQAKLNEPERLFHYPNGPDRNPHFDLWRANAAQLEELGVQSHQIEVSGIDTAQNTHDFYSHRAEKGQCGLFAMMAWID